MRSRHVRRSVDPTKNRLPRLTPDLYQMNQSLHRKNSLYEMTNVEKIRQRKLQNHIYKVNEEKIKSVELIGEIQDLEDQIEHREGQIKKTFSAIEKNSTRKPSRRYRDPIDESVDGTTNYEVGSIHTVNTLIHKNGTKTQNIRY